MSFFLLSLLMFHGNSIVALMGIPPYNFALNTSVLTACVIFGFGFLISLMRCNIKLPRHIIYLLSAILASQFWLLGSQNYVKQFEHSVVFFLAILASFAIFNWCKYLTFQKKLYITHFILLTIYIAYIIIWREKFFMNTNRNYVCFSLISYSIFLCFVRRDNSPVCFSLMMLTNLLFSLFVLSFTSTFVSLVLLLHEFIKSGAFRWWLQIVKIILAVALIVLTVYSLIINSSYFLEKSVDYASNMVNPDRGSKASGAQRAIMVHIGLDLISDKSFTGVGLLNSRFYWSTGRFSSEVTTHLHNSYLELIVSYGIIGGFFFFYLLYWNLFKSIVQFKVSKYVARGSLFLVLISLTNTVFLHPYLLIWLVVPSIVKFKE